jgi:hypothetical protein
MQLELSNFQPIAANEAIEEEAPDLTGAELLSEPMIEDSDQGLASLIRSVGMTSIADDNLVIVLQGERPSAIRRGARPSRGSTLYIALTGAASASVKIIFDALRAWRTADHPAPSQSQASAFDEITDAVVADASDWGDGPSRSFG